MVTLLLLFFMYTLTLHVDARNPLTVTSDTPNEASNRKDNHYAISTLFDPRDERERNNHDRRHKYNEEPRRLIESNTYELDKNHLSFELNDYSMETVERGGARGDAESPTAKPTYMATNVVHTPNQPPVPAPAPAPSPADGKDDDGVSVDNDDGGSGENYTEPTPMPTEMTNQTDVTPTEAPTVAPNATGYANEMDNSTAMGSTDDAGAGAGAGAGDDGDDEAEGVAAITDDEYAEEVTEYRHNIMIITVCTLVFVLALGVSVYLYRSWLRKKPLETWERLPLIKRDITLVLHD